MRTTVTSSLALLLAFLATSGRAVAQTSSPEARPAPPSPPPRTLRVNAEGNATVRPDLAVVLAGVQVTAKDPQKASDDASARMKALLAELRRLGLAERDVQTSELSLRPERPWENGRQLPVQGYTATMSVRVKVRKLEQLPGLLGRLTAVGVNDIDSVQLGKEELGPVRDQALALAVSAARARAQARCLGHATEDEIRVLMLHGLLHLMGMDHETDGGRMARAEKRWRRRLGLPIGLVERTAR